MAAQKGKDLLLKTGEGAGSFTTFAGLRARALARELFFNGTIRPWQIVVPDSAPSRGRSRSPVSNIAATISAR